MTCFKKISESILDIFFPPLCLICGKYLEKRGSSEPICKICSDKIIIHRYPEKIKDLVIRAATDYRDKNIKSLIRLLKYKNFKTISITLGRLLSEHLAYENIDPKKTIIVPIPLHPSKEKERGYNQSELIANAVSKRLGINIQTKILRRIKKGKPQASIEDHKKRVLNIHGAFAAGKENHLATGKTIILIDDVFTSGATMKEAIREIRKMKPHKIIPAVVAIAR